jgi:FkbM family methyltransferase
MRQRGCDRRAQGKMRTDELLGRCPKDDDHPLIDFYSGRSANIFLLGACQKMKRYWLLLKRMAVAAKLGFRFVGTTHTQLPSHLRLFNKKIPLTYPNDPTLISDFIGVFLDDDYGLRTARYRINTVVDVGANIGLFSLWARHHFPEASIHAYEPNKEICNLYTAANLKDAKIVLFNEGVSGEDSMGRLVTSGSSRYTATTKDSKGGIKLTGIESVIGRLGGEIDLLKLDCEGAEWDIFLRIGAFRRIRQIRMEYHLGEGHDLTIFKKSVSDLGFHITNLKPDDGFGIAWLENCR